MRIRRLSWIASFISVLAGLAACVDHGAGRHEPATTSVTAPAAPSGSKAVGALGLEIYVPSDAAIDPQCPGNSINVYRPTATNLQPKLPCPSGRRSASVTIGTPAQLGAVQSGSTCTTKIVLDAESACVEEFDGDIAGGEYIAVASWPQHDVGIKIDARPDAYSTLARKIIKTAHWVGVDRDGCPAKIDKPLSDLPPDQTSTHRGDSHPTSITRVDVCWYRVRRLVASGTASGSAAARLINTLMSLPPKWPAPESRPSLPPCTELWNSEGVTFRAYDDEGNISPGAALVADCDGQRTAMYRAGDRDMGYLMDKTFTDALREATGIPIYDAYDSTQDAPS